MDYVENVTKDVFFLEQMLRQQQMKRYIQECQILASGEDIPYKLNSLNEDLSESIKGLWTKIKTIFNRIWLKFLERIDKFCKDDASYLDQYKNIILNKKVPEANFNMPDYSKARERCFKEIPDFSSIINPGFTDEMKKQILDGMSVSSEELETKKDGWRLGIRQAFAKAINLEFRETDDFNSVVKEHYGGGASIDVSSSEINMADAYNLCYSADVYIKNLKKDQTKYNEWVGKVEKEYTAGYKGLMEAVRKNDSVKKSVEAGTDKTDPDTHKSTVNTAAGEEIRKMKASGQVGEKDAEKTAAATTAQSSAKTHNEHLNLYSVVYNNVLNEDGVQISSAAKSSGGSDSSVVKPTGTATGAEGMNTKETNRKMNNTMVSNTKNREADAKVQIDAAGASGRAAAAEIAGKDASKITEASVNTYTNMVTTYTTMATETISAIFGSKCNAIERMRRDYMTIIRFHVKYWLGRPNNSDDNVTPTSSGSGAPGLGTVQSVAQPNATPAPATP